MSARRKWGAVLAALLLVGCAPVSPHEGSPTAPPTTGTASASDTAETDDGQSARQGDATADVMRGVTLDSVDDLGAAERAIDALPFTATVRLVTDPERGPDDYQEAITALSSQARLVVQLVDSTAMAGLGVEEARSRARAFVERYAGQVEVWEVGNEVNGAWAGTGPQEINAKVLAMAEQVRAAGEPTAITVNLWSRPDCYEEEWEDEAAYLATVPAPLAGAIDYAFLSAYETACDPVQRPSAAEVGDALEALGAAFPNARLGIGEIGAQRGEDSDSGHIISEPTRDEKIAVARRWIGMNGQLAQRFGDRYVGGWFWWYFRQDVADAPAGESIGGELADLLGAL